MNKLIPIGLGVLLCAAPGCKPKPKVVAPIARAEAAQNASEADFAFQIRDYTRAEGLLAKAVELDPTVPRYWKELGSTQKHLNNLSAAKKAYETSLDLLKEEYKRDPSSPAALVGAMETCVLLGKKDEAQNLLNKALRDHPDDPQLKSIVESKVVDKLAANPAIQSSAL